MISSTIRVMAIFWVVPILSIPAFGVEPFRYSEAKHGKGELRYVDHIPVLIVQGTPEEMGEQLGVLALKPASPLTKLADDFIKKSGWESLFSLVLKTGNVLASQFPPHHLKELESAAKASEWSLDLLKFGNTIPDLRKLGGCSSLVVEPSRSATGSPLFGRNLDWPPFANLHEYVLVVIYRPKGKRAFASITYPGMVGCASGINDAGLALADLTVTASKDASLAFDPKGIPYTLAMRLLLEECATIEEAEKIRRTLPRTTMQNIALCDTKQGAVFELTPKNVLVRKSEQEVCVCTNHFRTEELAVNTNCNRYTTLEKSREMKKLTLEDMKKKLDEASQGQWTQQSMIFEPATLTLHLAYGKGPATKLTYRKVELKRLFEKGWEIKEK